MKHLKKITLASLSKSELEQRSSKKLLGGANCCICGCKYFNLGGSSTLDNGNTNNAGNLETPDSGGYGSGSFAWPN